MRRWGWGVCLWLSSLPAMACLNAPATRDHDGRWFETYDFSGDRLVTDMTRPMGEGEWLIRRERIVKQARAVPDFDNLTDLGVLLVYLGDLPSAVRLFLEIERLHPGRHETAANLGTALELMGRDATALRWIRIGIRRDAHEHAGTEWLHARILEAKLALAEDPHALDGRSGAGVRFAEDVVPPLPAAYPDGNDGRPVAPHELERAFRYQLRERLPFVPPKDPVVANLLTDWATLNLAGGPIENADAFYRLAIRYGARRTPLMRARQRYVAKTMAASKRNPPPGLGHCPICPPLKSHARMPPQVERKPGEPPPPPPPPPYIDH